MSDSRDLLDRLCKLFSSPGGRDLLLKVLSYSMSYIVGPKLRGDAASDVVSAGGAISMARYVLRFSTIVDYVQMLRRNPYRDPVARRIHLAQAVSLALYYPTEVLAWMGYYTSNKTLRLNADKWSSWSCWCWFAYIVLDLVRILREARDVALRQMQCKAVPGGAVLTGEGATAQCQAASPSSPCRTTSAAAAAAAAASAAAATAAATKRAQELSEELTALRVGFIDNLANLPLALMWASGRPRLPPWVVGLLGLTSAGVSGWARWRAL